MVRVALILILAASLIVGQVAEDFLRFRAQYDADARDRSENGLRALHGRFRVLESLALEQDAAVRADVESFLRQEITEFSAPGLATLRGEAIETLGGVLRDERSVEFLLALAAARSSRDTLTPWRVGRALARLRDPDSVGFLLKLGLASNDPTRRLVALEALGALAHPSLQRKARQAREALEGMLVDPSAAVRAGAVRALGNLGIEGLAAVLLKSVRDPTVSVRVEVARALVLVASRPAEWSGLLVLLEDASPRVREEAARSLALGGHPSVTPLLVARLPHEPLRQRLAMIDSLKVLTGRDAGQDPAAWVALTSARPGSRVGMRQSAGGEGRYDVAYHGIPLRSDRVVFVLDISMSMRIGATAAGASRMERAKEELIRVLEALPSDVRFGVEAFSTGRVWLDRDGLVNASPSEKRRAARFVRSLQPAGGTDSHGALEEAFLRFEEADTIFFLSDGRPSRGAVTDTERISAKVHAWNRERGVRLNTIALIQRDETTGSLDLTEDDAACARFMETLATLTQGYSVVVR